MVGFVTIFSENFKLKHPKKCKKNVFIIYSPEKETIEEADTLDIDTELSIKLHENVNAFLTTKFEGQKIQKIIDPTNGSKRPWINLLNESYFNKYQINKEDVIGYLIIGLEDIKVHYTKKEKPSRKKTKQTNNYLPKDWSERCKNYFQKKKDVSSSNRRVFK